MDKNIQFQKFAMTQTKRAQIKNHTSMCLWMTGLSGPCKSTLWNMAAGHAILQETDGEIFEFDYHPLVYNVDKLLNPDLITVRDKNVKFNLEEKHES